MAGGACEGWNPELEVVMDIPIQEMKTALREQVVKRLSGIPAGERTTASAQARALLAQQTVWQSAQTILFFAPLPGELDVWPLLPAAIEAGKSVALPRFDRHLKNYTACHIQDPETDLHTGHFGIREPNTYCSRLSSSRVDLILVPGVAFDAKGHRLGRGKGYYDQLLTVIGGKRCGVAFEEQFVAEVPVEPHDARMDYLLMPTRWVEIVT
jgi:5-formyltetrahydrofolate cyclo-ligase